MKKAQTNLDPSNGSMSVMPVPEDRRPADQLIEKIAEFEHQINLDRKTTIDEINEQLSEQDLEHGIRMQVSSNGFQRFLFQRKG